MGEFDQYVTHLSPTDEQRFSVWRSRLPKALQYDGNYDLRGFFMKNPTFSARPGQHMTDEFKLPNHPTFSDESRYYNADTAPYGGHWNGDLFSPNNRNIKAPVDERKAAMTPMQQLFSQVPESSQMQPSAVRPDNSITLEGLGNAPNGVGLQYERMMQLLTQPKHDMSPAARRAAALMPAGPRDVVEPVELQHTPAGQLLMALLFGGGMR